MFNSKKSIIMFAIILLIGAALTGIPLSKDDVSQRCINICLIYIVAVAVYLMFIIGFWGGLIITCCFSIYSLFQILVMYGETEKSPPKNHEPSYLDKAAERILLDYLHNSSARTPKKVYSAPPKASFDPADLSYEVVTKIERLNTPVEAYYVYSEHNGIVSKTIYLASDIKTLDIKKGTRLQTFYKGEKPTGTNDERFRKYHPIGSTITGYVESATTTTVTMAFPLERELSTFGPYKKVVTQTFIKDPLFPLYCRPGNKITAVVADYRYPFGEFPKYGPPEYKLILGKITVTY